MEQSDKGSIRGLVPGILVQTVHGCSFILMEICVRGLIVLAQVKWLIGDETSVNMSQDAWISSLPLSWWPIYVSMEMNDQLWVCDLLTIDAEVGELKLSPSFLGASLLVGFSPFPFRSTAIKIWECGVDHTIPRLVIGSLLSCARLHLRLRSWLPGFEKWFPS